MKTVLNSSNSTPKNIKQTITNVRIRKKNNSKDMILISKTKKFLIFIGKKSSLRFLN